MGQRCRMTATGRSSPLTVGSRNGFAGTGTADVRVGVGSARSGRTTCMPSAVVGALADCSDLIGVWRRQAAHAAIDAVRTRGDRGIGHIEPRPLGQKAAIRGTRDRSLLDGGTAERGGRRRHSLRPAQYLGGSEASRNLSSCTSKHGRPHANRGDRAGCLGVHTAVERFSRVRLSRHCSNHLWPCRSLASVRLADATIQCSSSLTNQSGRRCLAARLSSVAKCP